MAVAEVGLSHRGARRKAHLNAGLGASLERLPLQLCFAALARVCNQAARVQAASIASIHDARSVEGVGSDQQAVLGPGIADNADASRNIAVASSS